MGRNILISGVIWVLLIGSRQAGAIATSNDTISAQSPTNKGYSLNWDYIYKYKNSSSVAVDHYWILTAAHVADDGASGILTINGETYTPQETIYHSTADLALVRFDKPFPGYYPLHEGEIHNEKNGPQRVWDPLVMVGYGFPGTVTAVTFTQSGSAGTKRWGTNRGIGEALLNVNVGGTAGDRSTQCFQTIFDLIDTPYEAGGNVYDSGGPVFIERDSVWKLAGINLYRDGANPYTGNRAALVPDYVAWIKSIIVDYDTDMDGLPDWWEVAYAGDETSMEPDGHSDEDGFTNYEEWFANTDPTNSTSHFEIFDWSAPTNVTFSSSSNRQYQIESRIDLVDTNLFWETEVAWTNGLDGQTSKSLTGSSSNRFFRIRVKLR